MKNWFYKKINGIFQMFSARSKKLQRDFNIIAGDTTTASRIKVKCVLLAGIMPLLLVVAMAVMMHVLTVKMLCKTVIAAVQKLKLNTTMSVRTDNSPTKASSKRKEARDEQKPDHHFFGF